MLIALFGCKSIDVQKVKKQLFLPGYNHSKPKINYSTTIISRTEFKIVSLKIDKIDQEFTVFSIIELPSGKLKKVNQKLLAGSYYIELSIPENLVSKESIDLLTISVKINNKLLDFKKETFLAENLFGK